jgi:hypothetical protein
MTALRDAITERQRAAESSSRGVTADQSTRLDRFCAALVVKNADSTDAAIADGIAAAAAIVAASLPQASQADWSAFVTDIPAIACRKLTLDSQAGDALELFLDAKDAFYLGNLSRGPIAGRTTLSFRILNEPDGARTRPINGTDSDAHDAVSPPAFGDPFAIAAKAAAALLASELLASRPKVTAPSPGHVPEASTPPIRFCEQCGHPRKQGARFCGQCGAAFPDSEPPRKSAASSAALACSACGAERAPQWKFCKRCGSAFSAGS